MILYLYKHLNNKFEKTHIIENAKSVMWTTRYYDSGDFEINVPATSELIKAFKSSIFITRENDSTVMMIEKIVVQTDIENGDYICVSGRSAQSILSYRVISEQTNINSTVENAIYKLLNENIVGDTTTNSRKITELKLSPINNWTEKIVQQITGENLMEAISRICKEYDYGFKITIGNSNYLYFTLYKGTDHSINQNQNTHVIFSEEFENLSNTEYVFDKSQVANYAIVAGEGEGKSRTKAYVRKTQYSGLYSREMWVDARDISSNDGEITSIEYARLLAARGNQELQPLYAPIQTFMGRVINRNDYIYDEHYSLGDKVTIKNKYGIVGNAIISEITEIEDEHGVQIIPTLTEWSE